MAKDDRKIHSNIITPHPAPRAKTPGVQTKSWGPDDDFDELENHLTPEDVERLTTKDAETGLSALSGNWTGRAKRDEDGKVVPAKSAKKAKGDAAAGLEDCTKDDLRELADANGVDCPSGATKAELVAALDAAGVKPKG